MNVLDLFSGIGGFSLGLERAGMRTVAFCEIDPFCRAVLAQHWPGVPIHTDVRTLHGAPGDADLICGGFPCQDISVAGKGAGLAGERSGLWTEYARLVREIRPRYVIVENVAGLLGRGLAEVLGDLAAIGYDAQWHCIPAAHVGAPHRRDRIWIVAYPEGAERNHGSGRGKGNVPDRWGSKRGFTGSSTSMAHADREGQLHRAGLSSKSGDGGALGDADGQGLPPSGQEQTRAHGRQAGGMPAAADWWLTEPDVGRVAHGIPARVDRLRSLGNAVVPQIPEIIGRAIMRAHEHPTD